MKARNNERVVGVCTSKLEITERQKQIPMMGWHSPYADFEWKGETWQVCISGGCQGIWVGKKSEPTYYSVELSELLPVLMDAVSNIRNSKPA